MLHVRQICRAGEIGFQMAHPCRRQMRVRIVETGHNEVPAKIDDLSLAALELLNVFVGSDRGDTTIANRQRLRAGRLRLGVDVSIDEDRVRQPGNIIRDCTSTNHENCEEEQETENKLACSHKWAPKYSTHGFVFPVAIVVPYDCCP